MWWFPSGVTDKNNEQKISIQGGEEKSVPAPPIDGEMCHRPPPLNCRNSTDKLVSDTSSIKNASTPSPQKNGQKGVIYFRSILPSDRSVIQVLHEEWFPVDYKDDFFDALCNERVMPVSGEPLHCCVACFKELSDIEFEEVKQMSVQGKPTGYLRSKRMISAVCNNSKHPMLEGIGDFILWDHEYSVEKSNTRHHEYEVERMPTINGNEIHPATNTLPLLSTSNAPSYCIPTAEIANNINPEESLRESRARMQREKTERFYQNGFRFDDDEESKSSTIMDLNCSNHTSQSHNLNADECIVGCLVGSFLPSKTPSKRSGKLLEAQSDPRDETCKILIPDPDRHTRMFYIMTLGTAREFRRAGLGSILVDRVLDMINKMPECGALYLHVITYNVGAIRLYERLGFSKVKEIEDYYSINNVNHNCYLYARYFHGNRGHKTIYDVMYDFATSILKNVLPWRN
mmetsp:Transcript_19458/g.39031  ORF Transcript_19458/g.39031 Transcript_19458/m.39031 type:complete len:458 (+) Transcript_19458:80-1453(+)